MFEYIENINDYNIGIYKIRISDHSPVKTYYYNYLLKGIYYEK